jgi:hypothetical protein
VPHPIVLHVKKLDAETYVKRALAGVALFASLILSLSSAHSQGKPEDCKGIKDFLKRIECEKNLAPGPQPDPPTPPLDVSDRRINPSLRSQDLYEKSLKEYSPSLSPGKSR